MKKFISVPLAFIMTLFLVACGATADTASSTTPSGEQSSEPATVVAEPEIETPSTPEFVTVTTLNGSGNGSRCSLIGNEVGFENLANDVDTTHRNESSFELLVSLDPDYILVLDRDSAMNTEGAQLAQEVMDNELVHKTTAYQNGNIVYLTPTVWYLAEGGITATDIMLQDLEKSILSQ